MKYRTIYNNTVVELDTEIATLVNQKIAQQEAGFTGPWYNRSYTPRHESRQILYKTTRGEWFVVFELFYGMDNVLQNRCFHVLSDIDAYNFIPEDKLDEFFPVGYVFACAK